MCAYAPASYCLCMACFYQFRTALDEHCWQFRPKYANITAPLTAASISVGMSPLDWRKSHQYDSNHCIDWALQITYKIILAIKQSKKIVLQCQLCWINHCVAVATQHFVYNMFYMKHVTAMSIVCAPSATYDDGRGVWARAYGSVQVQQSTLNRSSACITHDTRIHRETEPTFVLPQRIVGATYTNTMGSERLIRLIGYVERGWRCRCWEYKALLWESKMMAAERDEGVPTSAGLWLICINCPAPINWLPALARAWKMTLMSIEKKAVKLI